MATYSLKEARDRLERFGNSWQANAPSKEFGDVKMTDVDDKITAFDARAAAIADAKATLKRLGIEHNDATKKDMKDLDYVARAVEGDRKFGPDSALYAGFGYIRESEKKKAGGRKKSEPKP